MILLGPSGSGKTTLLSCLAALLEPAPGTIHVGDVEVTALRGAALGGLPPPPRRDRLPGVQPDPQPDRARERRGAAAARRASRGGRRMRAPRSCSRASGSPTAATTAPVSSPAASSSGWRSPARWSTTRRWSWPTSRPRTSTTCRSRRCSVLIRELAAPGRLVVVATHDDRFTRWPTAWSSWCRGRDEARAPGRRRARRRRDPLRAGRRLGPGLRRRGGRGDLAASCGGGRGARAARARPLVRRDGPAARAAPRSASAPGGRAHGAHRVRRRGVPVVGVYRPGRRSRTPPG